MFIFYFLFSFRLKKSKPDLCRRVSEQSQEARKSDRHWGFFPQDYALGSSSHLQTPCEPSAVPSSDFTSTPLLQGQGCFPSTHGFQSLAQTSPWLLMVYFFYEWPNPWGCCFTKWVSFVALKLFTYVKVCPKFGYDNLRGRNIIPFLR